MRAALCSAVPAALHMYMYQSGAGPFSGGTRFAGCSSALKRLTASAPPSLSRSQTKMSDQQQQNQTRWAVYQAASLLRTHQAEYAALQAAMARGASVVECIQAIENC